MEEFTPLIGEQQSGDAAVNVPVVPVPRSALRSITMAAQPCGRHYKPGHWGDHDPAVLVAGGRGFGRSLRSAYMATPVAQAVDIVRPGGHTVGLL